MLDSLSIEQKAQFILQPDSGVLGSESVFREVFSSVITSLDLNQLGSFFTTFQQTAIQVRTSVFYKPGHILFIQIRQYFILCIVIERPSVPRLIIHAAVCFQLNITSIPSAISDIVLNMTLLDLEPHLQSFSPEDFALWFQTYLSIFLPGIGPNTLSIIPMSISCDSYREM